jgi:Holliday junction resolvase
MRFRFTEDFVSYATMRALRSAGWNVLHYHPPGGQASTHFHFSDGVRFTPDIVAVNGNRVLVIESKGRRSSADVQKLAKMRQDAQVAVQIRAFARTSNGELVFVHAFGEDSDSDLSIYEIRVRSNGAAQIGVLCL